MEDPLPTYQYACTDCGHRFEAFQSFSDSALTECPECGGKLRKVYGSVGVVFKGSGFYRNDARAGAKKSDGARDSGGTSGSGGSDASATSTPASEPKTSKESAASTPASAAKPAATSTSSSSSSSSGAAAG